MAAYRGALEEQIKPGSRVMDLGAGTGVFAVLACQLGAEKVYAVEPDGAIEVARKVAADNDQADRIEFIPKLSTEITLDERVDLIVADLGGVLPLFGSAIPSMIDARERFLRTDGSLLPMRDTLRAALAEAPASYAYDAGALADLPVDMTAATALAVNGWFKADLSPQQLLTEPSSWAQIDYPTATSPDVEGETHEVVSRAGTAHGFGVWFDRKLTASFGYSTGPDQDRTIYGHAFFPLERPVDVAPGDAVEARLEAHLVDDAYVWRWDTRIVSGDDAMVKADFTQSTVRFAPVSLSRLKRREVHHRPLLNEKGEAESFALSLMDGESTVSEIADRLVERFPERFGDSKSALRLVARLSERYSR